MQRGYSWSLIGVIAACGSDGTGSTPIPPDAATTNSYVKSGVAFIVPRLPVLDGLLPFLLNPGSPGAAGIQFGPDPTPGAPPNSYVFAIPFDGNGDGVKETTVTGRGAFSDIPSNAGVGFGGHIDADMQTATGVGDFSGSLDFTFTAAGAALSGSGTFTDAVTGNSTTLTISSGAPLVIKPATGTGSSMANACAYSLNGPVKLDASGPKGSLSSLWTFASNQKAVSVTNATHTANGGTVTNLPNASVVIPCGGGSVSDWVGVFRQHWACLPPEFGQADLTFTVAAASTVSISDDDPPGSGDINVYQATAVDGNAHMIRGFFIGGTAGSTYREDFTWTLAPSGTSVALSSRYVYQQGPSTGSGGLCGGIATRMP